MNVQLASPLALLLLVAVPVLLLWELRGRRRRPALSLSSLASVAAMPATWRLRLRWLPSALRVLALVLLVVALARPQSGRADALLPQEGIDIVVALDTSTSMRSPVGDREPGLVIAQRVLRDFVAERERDRLALVIFRQRSLVLSPLTSDYEAFQTLVDETGAIDLPDGTSIGLAVTDAVELLRESKARSRIIILLSDGENNQPEVEPLTAAQVAQALGVRLYTVGIAGRDLERPNQAASEATVNEPLLRSMADVADGRFFRADDPDTLAQVYDTIDELERSRVGPERFAEFDELAPWFLGAALAALLAEVLLASFVLRRLP